MHAFLSAVCEHRLSGVGILWTVPQPEDSVFQDEAEVYQYIYERVTDKEDAVKDIVCPNCRKDEYQIVQINGVKVKQCRKCGGYYQLAEKEIVRERVIKYLPGCKDAEGNFIKCPRCGYEDIKKISELSLGEYILLDFQSLLAKRRLDINVEDEYYLCRNPLCRHVWWKGLKYEEKRQDKAGGEEKIYWKDL